RGDEREQAVLDLVPLAGPRRKVAHHHGQPTPIRQSLHLHLPLFRRDLLRTGWADVLFVPAFAPLRHGGATLMAPTLSPDLRGDAEPKTGADSTWWSLAVRSTACPCREILEPLDSRPRLRRHPFDARRSDREPREHPSWLRFSVRVPGRSCLRARAERRPVDSDFVESCSPVDRRCPCREILEPLDSRPRLRRHPFDARR